MDERCTDFLDHAANITTEAAARSIAHISALAAKIDTSNPSGKCWNCGEHTGKERRFCNADCRDDWEMENK